MTSEEVRTLLAAKIEQEYGCVKRAAWKLDMAEEHLRKQMTGNKPPGRIVLKLLGLKRVFTYERG